MPGKPAARVSDPSACPLPGHGSNPIVVGSADVFFDGLAAVRQATPRHTAEPWWYARTRSSVGLESLGLACVYGLALYRFNAWFVHEVF